MRRMTISRSDLSLAAALLVAAAPGLAAQVRAPNIQRPIQAAQGAASATNQNIQQQQAPAETPGPGPRRTVTLGTPGSDAPAAQQGTTPSTHTVAQGETLWGLAQQYLGDPLLWPELYRLNTNVVEDPHWIYPGEELRLTAPPVTTAPAADTAVVVQQQSVTLLPADTQHVQGPVAPASGPTIFSQRNQVRSRQAMNLEVAANRAYRAVREGEYFSSGFLTEDAQLNTGRIVRTSAEERDMAHTRTAAFLYETIIITPPDGETLQPGDMLLAFHRAEDVSGYGDVVIPTGMVRVTGSTGPGNLMAARVTDLYASMEAGQELLKVQPFVYNASARAVPVTNGVQGEVIRLRDPRSVPQIQDVLFIDKGANDGVQLGDVFQLYIVRDDPQHGGTVEQDQGRAIIVNTRPRTATAVIVDLYRGDVGAQSQVRQIRRMPN